jgi:hypothetical protein
MIRVGDMKGAERTQNDMVVLSKAKGESLYDMHRLALPNTKIEYPYDRSLKDHYEGEPFYMIFGSAAAIGGAVALAFGLSGAGTPALVTGGVLLGAVGGYTLWVKNRIDTRNEANAIVSAVENNQAYIRGFVAPKEDPKLQIDTKVFLAALKGQEARLAAEGEYTRAGDIRKVHTALTKLEGKTVEELFQSLIASNNREALDLVQGKCSHDIAKSIETLAEVGKLVGPQGNNLLQEDQDSLIIGGVVLKKRSEAA